MEEVGPGEDEFWVELNPPMSCKINYVRVNCMQTCIVGQNLLHQSLQLTLTSGKADGIDAFLQPCLALLLAIMELAKVLVELVILGSHVMHGALHLDIMCGQLHLQILHEVQQPLLIQKARILEFYCRLLQGLQLFGKLFQ